MPGLIREPVYCSDAQRPLSVEDYHALIAMDHFDEDEAVELIEGVLVYKMPKNTKHTITSGRLNRHVTPALSAGWATRQQDPITLSDGEPEPDLAVVTDASADRLAGHPGPGEIALVIEIADSSLARDRGSKLRSYARAGIATYWIVNLLAMTIEVYTDPLPESKPPTYATRRDLTAADAIALPAVVGGATLRVADLLPA